jgi:hypothetical protein
LRVSAFGGCSSSASRRLDGGTTSSCPEQYVVSLNAFKLALYTVSGQSPPLLDEFYLTASLSPSPRRTLLSTTLSHHLCIHLRCPLRVAGTACPSAKALCSHQIVCQLDTESDEFKVTEVEDKQTARVWRPRRRRVRPPAPLTSPPSLLSVTSPPALRAQARLTPATTSQGLLAPPRVAPIGSFLPSLICLPRRKRLRVPPRLSFPAGSPPPRQRP